MAIVWTGLFLVTFGDWFGLQRYAAQLVYQGPSTEAAILGVCMLAMMSFIAANLAVKWYRFILLRETEALKNPFKFENQSVKYFFLAAAVGVAYIVLNALLARGTERPGFFTYAVILPAAFYLPVLLTRISLKLPAIAVDHNGFDIGSAMQHSIHSF